MFLIVGNTIICKTRRFILELYIISCKTSYETLRAGFAQKISTVFFTVISRTHALQLLKNSQKVGKGIESAVEADICDAHIAEAQEHLGALGFSDVKIVAVIKPCAFFKIFTEIVG